jgi:glucuronokinase
VIKKIAYPRAAVIGNPSDGFYGKTIAFPFSNFQAEAHLTEAEGIIIRGPEPLSFSSLDAFYKDYSEHGLSPQNPLSCATLRKFLSYCQAQHISLHSRGFAIEFESNIPREVGLAGSSAIITAIFRCLQAYYEVSIPPEQQANLILEVETKEMGISAGLQDRVVQVYEHPVYMNFDKALMQSQGYGAYTLLSPALFEHFYIAYSTQGAEASDVVHNDLRGRYEQGEAKVHQTMAELATLTETFLKALKFGQHAAIADSMNRNFDLRQSLCQISRRNAAMIVLARSVGASAKFTGSGGAIIGNYTSEEMYHKLEAVFTPKGIQLCKPTIVSTQA